MWLLVQLQQWVYAMTNKTDNILINEILDDLLERQQNRDAIKIALTTVLISLPGYCLTVNRDEYLNLINNYFKNYKMLTTAAIDSSNFTISLTADAVPD